MGHSSLALEAIYKAASKGAEALGQDLLLKTQEMMKKELGHADEGCLPETEIQCMLLGVNRILDYAPSMGMQMIKFEQHALWVISVAITGSACRKLLDILKATYGYPETLESRQQGMSLARFSHYLSATELKFPEETLEAAEETSQSAELTAVLEINPATTSAIQEASHTGHRSGTF